MTNQYSTVIVTGASSGIGAAIAQKFHAEGSTVYALSRNKAALSKVRHSLPREQQDRFIPIVCDVTILKDVEQAVHRIFAQTSVDLIVSNAGVGFSKPFHEHTETEMQQVLQTNLLGNIHVIKAALLQDQPGPLQIVCTSSLAGKIGFPNMSLYSASKFGLEGLIESLRNEYDEHQVRFTILRPGITGTPFFEKAGMQEFQASVQNLKSYYSPEKVAEIFFKNLRPDARTIVVGNDRIFLKLLPFIPFQSRFTMLDIINKL